MQEGMAEVVDGLKDSFVQHILQPDVPDLDTLVLVFKQLGDLIHQDRVTTLHAGMFAAEPVLVEFFEHFDDVDGEQVDEVIDIDDFSEHIFQADRTFERARIKIDADANVKTTARLAVAAVTILAVDEDTSYFFAIDEHVVDPF